MNSFLTKEELEKIGFKSIGTNVLISRHASIYGPENICIGNNVRVDDYCILSGNIIIGSFVHIACFCALFGGKNGIELKDFSGISSRSAIYADTDDYSGEFMSNPMIPIQFRNVQGARTVIGKHALVGSGCTILPGACVGDGTSVGSMSLVNKTLSEWGIYVGIPCKKIKDRSKKLLALEKEFISSNLN